MIEVKDFTFKYKEGQNPAIKDVNITIPDGAFVGITGAAGSGKSTLTYALNGIIPHCYPGEFYGSVMIEGLDSVEAYLAFRRERMPRCGLSDGLLDRGRRDALRFGELLGASR